MGFYHKELISHNSRLIYESKDSIGKKKKTGVWADPKSLSYGIRNVFICKQLEDKP